MAIDGVTPAGHVIPRHIAVVNHSTMATDEDVAFWVDACNIQLREHCAPLWDGEPPGLSFLGSADHIPANEAAVLGVVDDDGNASSAGYHTIVGDLVYGLVDMHQSPLPSVTMSHEALEMYGNARLVRTVMAPKGRRFWVELNDPTQRQTYNIEVELFGQRRQVPVSDFVLPRWFGLPQQDRRTTYIDQKVAPFEIAPGGYQIARESDGQIVFLSGVDGAFNLRPSRHSRTRRILDQEAAAAVGSGGNS